MSVWKVENIATLANGKKAKDISPAALYPIYGGNGIMGYTNSYNASNVVIIGRVGAYCGSVHYSKDRCWISDNAISAMTKDKNSTEYLYYLLSSLNLNRHHIGGAQPLMTQGIINNIDIPKHFLSEQKKIAAILSSLDEKIETNRKINMRLEELAQALFKSWFIDFEPFGGKMPEDWKTISLKNCTHKISDGVHNTIIDTPNSNYYLLSCKNIIGGKLSITVKERTIDFNTFQKLRKRTLLEKNDILLSSVGTIGEIVYLTENLDNVEFQRSVAMIKANRNIIDPVYLFYWLKSQKKVIVNMAHGAVQQCLFLKDIEEISVRLPSEDMMGSFAKIGHIIQNYINVINKKSSRLASLRDTLLPKLMSGEIKIS